MPKYVYGGANKRIGRFGPVVTGQVLDLTQAEADAVKSDTTNWQKVPQDADSVITDNGSGISTKSAAYTITTSDRLIKADTNAAAGAFTLTLPASPAFGQVVEVVDTGGAADTKNVTIDRNGNTIDGAATNKVIDTAGGSVRIYYTGAEWKTF